MLRIERQQLFPLATLLAVLLPFAAYFAYRRNYEFILYIAVIVFFLALIAWTNDRVRYPLSILWGLVAWAVMHLCGGGIRIGEGVLYGVMLLPLSSTLPILRYDQVVHIIGFGVATLLMYHLLTPLLRPDLHRRTALSIVITMAGLGAGALNEIVEFIATVLVPETGVGGYLNTALDLVADLIGALLALLYLHLTQWRTIPDDRLPRK